MPLFIVLRTVKLIDTYAGLILVYMLFNLPFAVWALLGYLNDIPFEVEEAALVDGCTRLQVVRHIVFPLAMPGIVVVFLFCFLFAWNEYTFAFLLAGKDVTTLPVILPRFAHSYEVFRGLVAAAATIAVGPAVLLAVFLQRFMVKNLTFGALD